MAKKPKPEYPAGGLLNDILTILYRRASGALVEAHAGDPNALDFLVKGEVKQLKLAPGAEGCVSDSVLAASTAHTVSRLIARTPARAYLSLDRGVILGLTLADVLYADEDKKSALTLIREARQLGGRNSAKIKDSDRLLLESAHAKGQGSLKKTTVEFNRHRGGGNKVSAKTVGRALRKFGIVDNTSVDPAQH